MDKIFAVGLVKNEEDIIKYTINHFVAEGVDGIVIQDNGSSDNTPNVLMEIQDDIPIPMYFIQEKLDAPYDQSGIMTRLANYAASCGGTYIIPFDADELWYSSSGILKETILNYKFRQCHVEQFFHYCTKLDDTTIKNPYKKLLYCTKAPAPWRKVCFRWMPGDVIGGGNHTLIDSTGNLVSPDVHNLIKIRHLPCRSFEQMLDKIIRHGKGMDAQYPNDPDWGGDGPAQRDLYRIYQACGPAPLRDIWKNGHPNFDHLGFRLVKFPQQFGLIKNAAPYKDWR